jgi:arylformamidase
MIYDLSRPIFQYARQRPDLHSVPVDHFRGPCVALDLRHKEAASEITIADLEPHAKEIRSGVIALLKTGWGEKQALSMEFLTAWPYLSAEAAEYLVLREVHGVGIEGLSIGGFEDLEEETAAHRVLLGAKKLIVEDLRVPEQMLDGQLRHFAAIPVQLDEESGAWTRPVAWDATEPAWLHSDRRT